MPLRVLEREQVADRLEYESVSCAVEQDTQGTAVAVLRLYEYLPAGAAGGDGRFAESTVVCACGYGDGGRSQMGIARIGIEHGAAFRASARRVSRILLIAAADRRSVLQPYRRANVKM